MCVLETIWKTIERNHTNENKCIIKGIIRWKIPYRSKKTFQILTYILNGWEINENCFSEIKVHQMKKKLIIIRKDFLLYYLVNERFMLLNT